MRPVTEIMAEDVDQSALQRASYRRRTERVIEAIKGKVGEDFRRTPVDVCVLRKVDPGNCKVIFHRATSVGELWDAATAWAVAEGNFPDWLRMPVPGARGRESHLEEPSASCAAATTRRDPSSVHPRWDREGRSHRPYRSGCFSLFLNDGDAPRRARLALRLVMDRHGPLLSGSAQALRKGFERAKEFDRVTALKSVTLLGVLLGNIGRRKEAYMDETGFRLGQLLAIADVIHVGYCADRRNGDLPPVLLGNSVLAMARSSPIRALAVLLQRWKPYGAWAKLPATWDRGRSLRSSKDPKEGNPGLGYYSRRIVRLSGRGSYA